MILDELKFEISVAMVKMRLTIDSDAVAFQKAILEIFNKEYKIEKIDEILKEINIEQKIPDFKNLEIPNFMY